MHYPFIEAILYLRKHRDLDFCGVCKALISHTIRAENPPLIAFNTLISLPRHSSKWAKAHLNDKT